MPATTEVGRTAAATFAALQRHFGFSDEKLAELTGYTRSRIEQRRKGRASIDTDDLGVFSEFYGVPISVLLGEPADAIRYVLDHDITLEVERNNYSKRWATDRHRTRSDLPRRPNGWPRRLTNAPSPRRHAA